MGPAMDALPRFEVIEKSGKYFAKVPESLPASKETELGFRDEKDERKFVIVGGGMAGLSAAITLRQCRYGGRIILISGEDIYPYDRTILTKLVTFADARRFTLRSEELLKKHGIEV